MSQSMSSVPTSANPPSHVVGVGASAGGLEALGLFFDHLPVDTEASYVVIQHLSPDYESHMPELLRRHTSLEISLAAQGMVLQKGRVYLIPRGTTLMVSEGVFLLTEKDSGSVSYPIDTFFRSLAQDYGARAIGIILSGTGNDGSRGLLEIHEAGGLVIAQTEASARFTGMPESAIDTGVVDSISDPEGMGRILAHYFSESKVPEEVGPAALMEEVPRSALETIFAALEERYGIDFSQYKQDTISRRLQRRLDFNNDIDIDAYAARIVADPEEVETLYHDLLIGVTSFFRDANAFRIVADQIIPDIVKNETEQVRIWVPGCASGEEAYTIAMLFLEEYHQKARTPDFKVFASDVHPVSIRTASEGAYPPELVKTIPSALRQRYFEEKEGLFYPVNALRKRIIFTEHNLMTSIPFTRLNFISCRNMLIYLEPPAQKKIISLFHFALRSSGVLMLGPSETLGDLANEFITIDKSWRIFRKRRQDSMLRHFSGDSFVIGGSAGGPLAASSQLTERRTPPLRTSAASWNRVFSTSELMRTYDFLLETFMPPAFLVDEHFELLHTFPGGEEFLQIRSGRNSHSLLDLVHPALRSTLSSLGNLSLKGERTVRYDDVKFQREEEEILLHVTARNFTDEKTKLRALILTLEEQADPLPAHSHPSGEDIKEAPTHQTLELRLQTTQENLQSAIEELETSNEELQATNEELVASNEELQSSNEELHSVNEELDTVNNEYQGKIRELIRLTDDTDNLLASTALGVIFLDPDFKLRKITPRITEDFRIIEADLGRNFTEFFHPLTYSGLTADLESVLRKGIPREVEINLPDERQFLLRISPYQSESEEEGLVLSIVEITSVRDAQNRLDDLSTLVEFSNDAIIGFNSTGRITNWNAGARELYGYTEEEAIGQNALDLIIPAKEAGKFLTQLEAALNGTPGPVMNVLRLDRDQNYLTVSQRLSTAADCPSGKTQVSSIERDVTTELRVRGDRDRLASVLEATSDFVSIYDREQRLVYANRAGLLMAGFDPATDPTTLTLADFYRPDALEDMSVGIRHAIQSEAWKGEGTLTRRDGTSIPVSQVILSHWDAASGKLLLSTVSRDLSQERNAIEIGNTLSAVVQDFPEMLVVFNQHQDITFASPSAMSFIAVHGVDHPGGLPLGLHELVQTALIQNQPFQPLDFEGVRNLNLPDGSTRSYLPRVSVLHSARRKVAGAVLIIQDVTEFRMLDDIKTSLIGTVSHELKNPVAGITMTLGLALDGTLGELNPTQRESLEAAMHECHRITATIKGLLDLTRFEEENARTHRSREKPSILVTRAVRNSHLLASRHQVRLEIDTHPGLSTVLCDPERVVIVLDNLISNAIKHSPADSTVVVSATSAPEGGVLFSVRDQGPGIPEKYHDKVFSKFFRTPGNTKSGSGLGLNIARQFVEAHGGHIEFENCQPQGCRFSFRLPASPLTLREGEEQKR